MRKLIAAINMTLDGVCDHRYGIADDEIHQHYTDLLLSCDVAIWGRVTFQLMEYWKSVVESPTGVKSKDEFATAIDRISKIVYSRTLKTVDWNNTEIKANLVKEEILDLKQRPGKPILVGSPSMIVNFGNLGLIDEYQITIHPMVIGSGLRLFDNIAERIDLKLLQTKTFGCGSVTHYYQPTEGRL
jgi:dihydrofolate reductase